MDLDTADEIFLTNAVRGIRWVKKFRENELNNQVTSKIFSEVISPLA
jgi:branched-chain amino acid aminotransferase